MNIYVGNLSAEVTDDDLRAAFEALGQVETANVIKDKFSGESRGFGFVEMPGKDEAQKAIEEMNGKELQGRTLTVNEARPKRDRGGGGFGGGRGGGRCCCRGGGGGGRRYYEAIKVAPYHEGYGATYFGSRVKHGMTRQARDDKPSTQ